MHGIGFAAGVALIVWVLWDAFETILLPRRVPARLRLSRFFLRWLWTPWSAISLAIRHRPRRENFLGFYALLSILSLLAAWAAGLVAGFALVLWSEGSRIAADGEHARFALDFYLSGTTFFTLGLGDVRPMTGLARATIVVEAGMGFGFLALVISYLPVLYQAFSRREVTISLLDARAGSPPTAFEMLRRQSGVHGMEALTELLKDWELDLRELMVASEENMPGTAAGHTSELLRSVRQLLTRLGATEKEPAAVNKAGG